MKINQISLKPSAIACALGTVAILLVLASIGGQLMTYLTGHNHIYGLVLLFNVDAEVNIPSSFSTFLLFFSALLLAIIAILERKQLRSHVLYWAVLSLGFLIMTMDEALSFHERLIYPIRDLIGADSFGIFYYAWVIPFIPLVLILIPFYARFLLQLPEKTRLAFFVAAALYLGGAIGVELIGGYYVELHGKHNLTYSMIVTVEESLEMGGVILFIWALLVYIADNYQEVRFRIE
ncbi:hypothetical protein [Candidatus Nitrospira salsa]